MSRTFPPKQSFRFLTHRPDGMPPAKSLAQSMNSVAPATVLGISVKNCMLFGQILTYTLQNTRQMS
uniref:Uncharacterized protein n=1 Tax=Arion vulgaris TaxID=1028688 RepID=A0A0B6ZZT1_9EUPU